MIDLHSHILPGVDDGSQLFEESVEILRMSQKDGIKTIVSTPHMFSSLSKLKKIEELRDKFIEFRKKIDELDLEIKVVSGSENYFTSDLRKKLIEFRDILTINNSDYFLLEFPMNFIFPGTRSFIFDILNLGFIPVICHPERNTEIQGNPHVLFELVVAGALVQLDAGSIRGDFGSDPRETSFILLKNNLVHMIASDCHDLKRRPPGLSNVKDHLKWMEKEQLDLILEEIPMSVISNDGIPDIGPSKNPSTQRSVFSIFRRKN